ncbi:MAG: hypothetical protein KDC80_05415 [Saprospiraceae bacterium]|nr:hypothetical protein [Saprospiraceae bacterium]
MQRLLWTILLISSCYQVSLSQVDFECTIDSNQLLIGDQRILHLRARGPSGLVPDTVSFSAWQDLGIEPLVKQSWQSEGVDGYHQMIKIAAFDTGYIKLPPLILPYSVNGQTDTTYSNDIVLEVQGIVVDSTGLAPIKPILREPFKLRDALVYIVALLVGLAIIAFVFLRKKKPEPEPEIVEIPVPADELALDDLQKLRSRKLWQSGQIKEYQSELTHIIRAYIQARYSIPALESTTSEILNFAVVKSLSSELQTDLDQILNIADLIKFAKAQPEIGIHEEFMQKAEYFVRSTRESKSEPDV